MKNEKKTAAKLFVLFCAVVVWGLTLFCAIVFGLRLREYRNYSNQLTDRLGNISGQLSEASQSARDLSEGLGGSIGTVQDIITRINQCKIKAEDLERRINNINNFAGRDNNNPGNKE